MAPLWLSAIDNARKPEKLGGDSHYCCPEVLDFCRANGLDYILGVAPTTTLRKHVQGLEAATKSLYEAAPKDGKARRFKEFYDGATSLEPGRADYRPRRGGRRGPRHALRRHQSEEAQRPRTLRRLLLPARPSRKSHQVVEDAFGGGPALLQQGHGEPVAVVSALGRLLDHVGLACVDAEKIDMARRTIRHVALAPDQDRRARCRDEDDDPRALADILPGTGYFALRARSNPPPRHVTSGAQSPENRTLPR